MKLPEELLVRPVPGADDIVAFNFPFMLEGKAANDATPAVEILDDGDLIIEGWAAEFEGIDRQGENFIPGAFQRGIKSFMDGSAALCYHHKADQVLGKVLDLEEVDGRGLRMRARVDGAIQNHPQLGTIYKQIKNGTFQNLSVGGFFKRVMTDSGRRIGDMDFTEISITGVPVHKKPMFAVVAGKALSAEGAPETADQTDYSGLSDKLEAISAALDIVSERREGKAVKGDSFDLRFLATLLQLEQVSNSVVTGTDIDTGGDARVDALATRVKNYLDSVAREAHSLAAELGPLPQTSAAY